MIASPNHVLLGGAVVVAALIGWTACQQLVVGPLEADLAAMRDRAVVCEADNENLSAGVAAQNTAIRDLAGRCERQATEADQAAIEEAARCANVDTNTAEGRDTWLDCLRRRH